MDEKRISVIVPVYNVKKYVMKCLRSIQEQTYQNFEVIVVDDGSTDGSGAVCDEFAQEDAHFRVIHQQNGGLSAARNTGIDAAAGDYLMFVDSDDSIHPQMMEILYHCCNDYNAEVAVCSYLQVSEGEETDGSFIRSSEYHTSVVSGEESSRRIFTDTVAETVVSWNKLYRRDVFETIRFPVGKIHEDEFVTYKILYEASRVVYVDAVLYYYLRRSGSIMLQKEYGHNHMVLLEMARERIDFYRSKGNEMLTEMAVERAYGLCRMLYENYGEAGQRDLQQVVLKYHRRFFKHFQNLTHMGKIQEFTWWMYGYHPKVSRILSEIIHVLWKIKKSFEAKV